MVKLLRMKVEYIEWVKRGLKTATTRLKSKDLGEYELISGSYYKPIKSGVQVTVNGVVEWTRKETEKQWLDKLAVEEGFKSFEEFWAVLLEINKGKLDENTKLFTHYFTYPKCLMI